MRQCLKCGTNNNQQQDNRMNISDLTIGQSKEIAALFGQLAHAAPTSNGQIGKYVVVRTYSAGVHVGVLRERCGKEVVLGDARRLWQWQGALTLNEVASAGVASGSKISTTAPEVCLTEAIEVITCTEAAEENLRAAKWQK